MPYVTSLERIGIEKGIIKSIELLLNLKFGEEGLTLLPQIQLIHDQEKLETIITITLF